MSKPLSHPYSSWRDPNGPLQRKLLGIIDAAGHKGVTVRELYPRFSTNEASDVYAHHGWLSGALSTMHADLRIVRLADKRDGCKIYVHPDFIDSRVVEAQGRGGLSKDEQIRLQALDERLSYWFQIDTEGSRFGTTKTKAERYPAQFFREFRALYTEIQ